MMERKKHDFRLKYFLWATSLWVIFVFSNVIFTSQGWNRIHGFYPNLILMEGLILLFALASRRIREDFLLGVFLLVMPHVIYTIFIGAEMEEERESLFNFIYITTVAATVYFWNLLCLHGKRTYRVFISTGATILLILALNGWESYFWKNFWHERYHLIAYLCLLVVGSLLGYLFCLCRNMRQRVISGLFILSASTWCAICLPRIVETYLLYGSPTGATQQVINMKLSDSEGRQKTLSDFPTRYQVCLMWNVETNNNSKFYVQDFEKLALRHQYNPLLSFMLLGIVPDEYTAENDPFSVYETEHFTLPLLKVDNPTEFWERTQTYPKFELVCVFKNDTLVFQNNIEETANYIETLNK